MKDPVSGVKLSKELRDFPSTIRDQIFIECFQVFLLNAFDYDIDKQEFVEKNLISFVTMLAEVSPNLESGYEGDKKKLVEYAKRIVKMIDDCGTIQKAYYLACLTRAVKTGSITKNEFFKYFNCVKNLTEEDLQFLKDNLQQGCITDDKEYIDDIRDLGFIKEVDAGFA